MGNLFESERYAVHLINGNVLFFGDESYAYWIYTNEYRRSGRVIAFETVAAALIESTGFYLTKEPGGFNTAYMFYPANSILKLEKIDNG